MFTIRLGKRSFFDRKKVQSRAEKAEDRVQKRFGAFVRQRARSSLRTKRGISTPGAVPSSHTGRIKAGIFFARDPSRRSVLIGPVSTSRRGRANLGDLERGGSVGRMRYRARPFMTPAFEEELKGLPQMWRGQVR